MTLISEDLNDNVNVDIKNKFNRQTEDFTDNIQDLKPYKTKETMAIKKELEEVSDIKVCRCGETAESSELTDKLMTLTLEEKPIRKSEPQEDDERPDQPPEVSTTDLKKEDTGHSNKHDILVNLAAPSCDDNEDSEENDPDDPDKLKDRGPTNGLPSYHVQHNQSCSTSHAFQMPPNFPDYGNNCLDNVNQFNSNKRCMDMNAEPYKYTKPQNDLSNPTQSSRCVMSNVNQRQMSGGTVVTSPEPNQEVNFFRDPKGQMTNSYLDDVDLFLDQQSFHVEALGRNICEKFAPDDVNVDGYYSQSEEPTSSEPSPLGYNHSPPRTPMSNDSGVYSPMSDDSQGRSPRQTNFESYSHTYHSHMSPQHKVGASSPPHQSHHPAMKHQVQQTYQPPAMVPNSAVFQQQMNVSHRCNMPPQLQQVPCIENLEKESYYHPFIDENLLELQNALCVIGSDLMSTLEKKSLQSHVRIAEPTPQLQCAAPLNNIPKTVTSQAEDIQRQPQAKRIVQNGHVATSVQKKTPQLSSSPPQLVPVSNQAAPQAPGTAKLPIPPLRRSQPQQPVMTMQLNTNGPVPVFFIRPQPPTRYKEIRPKETSDPMKPLNSSVENLELNGTGTKLPAPAAPQQPNSTTNKVSLITIARRIVAEMPTSELVKFDADGDMVLHVSVCRPNCLYLVQALLERLNREGLDDHINAQNYNGQTPLYLAVSSNHPKVVKLLIEKNADVNPFAECKLPSGVMEKSAAIHCASSRGEAYLETLKELLNAPDINVHQFNSDGYTPLNCAILCHGKVETNGSRINSIPIIQTLIEAGADPNLQTQKSGKTSLMYALESRDIDLIEKIFQLVDPAKLPSYLKSNAFDGSTCQKIADSLRPNLDQADQHRLTNCMKPRVQRGDRS